MWEGRATPGAVAGMRESGHRSLPKNRVFGQAAKEDSSSSKGLIIGFTYQTGYI